MSKIAYIWDNNDEYYNAKVGLPDDYKLMANETFKKPEAQDGTGLVSPAHWNGTDWEDATTERHAEWQKVVDSQLSNANIKESPSMTDQAMNALGLQVSKLQKQNEQLNQAINLLGLQVAQSKKEGN